MGAQSFHALLSIVLDQYRSNALKIEEHLAVNHPKKGK
jgi:hypothetical protein